MLGNLHLHPYTRNGSGRRRLLRNYRDDMSNRSIIRPTTGRLLANGGRDVVNWDGQIRELISCLRRIAIGTLP